jgi:hypothetical protein
MPLSQGDKIYIMTTDNKEKQYYRYASIAPIVIGFVMVVSNTPNNAGLVFIIIGFTLLLISYPGKKK